MNTRALVAISAVVACPALAAQKTPDSSPYLIADRATEVALARTAAPSDVSGKATVLVLTAKGYVEAAHGTNGFKHMLFADDNAMWTAMELYGGLRGGEDTFERIARYVEGGRP